MHWRLFVLFLLVSGAVLAQRPPEVKLPDTYAATELKAWLRAFNSGDHKIFQDFRMTHFDKSDVTTADLDADVALRAFARGGVYDLRAIEHSNESQIVALLQSRRNGWWARVRLEVDPDYPHKITFLHSITSSRNPSTGLAAGAVR